jgi:hypothetical protein
MVIGGSPLCPDCSNDAVKIINRKRELGQQVNPSGTVRQLYRERNKTRNKILRDIPANICDGLRDKAISGKTTERSLILDALNKYLFNGEK